MLVFIVDPFGLTSVVTGSFEGTVRAFGEASFEVSSALQEGISVEGRQGYVLSMAEYRGSRGLDSRRGTSLRSSSLLE